MKFDNFFIEYMKKRYKLDEIVDQNIIQFLSAVLRYKNKDKRIDLFRRFLHIELDPIRVETLDNYLSILKSKFILK